MVSFRLPIHFRYHFERNESIFSYWMRFNHHRVDRTGRPPGKRQDLRQLKAQYPAKSFVYIFQSTKQGAFRGENSFQHDVDVVIEVPEKGRAVQMGRFNQGGEMEIFNRAA